MSTRTPRSVAVRLVAIVAILLTGTLTALPTAPVAAQGVSNVAIVTVENGQPAYDACYVFVGYSEIGCDENSDGKVTFEAIPLGTWTVRQTANLGSGRFVNDFTVRVTGAASGDGWERFTATIQHSGGGSSTRGSSASGFSNIAIVTTENGQPVYDACYVIGDYSNEGCDENRDGKITFEDIPLGTWTVHQTRNLGSGRSVSDFTIRVTGNASADGWERFPATVKRSGGTSSGHSGGTSGFSNIAIVTTENGQPVYDACYVIGDYSNEGCDENGDGKITFEDIPLGTWTVHQTRNLGSGRTVADFTIRVTGNASSDGWERFPAKVMRSGSGSSTSSGSAGSSGTGGCTASGVKSCEVTSLTVGCFPAEACYGATVTVTTQDGTSVGSCTMTGNVNDTSHPYNCGFRYDQPLQRGTIVVLTIDGYADGYEPEQNPLTYDTTNSGKASLDAIGFKLVPTGGSSGTRTSATTGTLSVVFWSPRDGSAWTGGECIQLKGATDLHCAHDYPNGNVVIQDIPAGTYEVCVTATGGEMFWGRNSAGPKDVTIVAGETLSIRVNMYHQSNYNEGLLCGYD